MGAKPATRWRAGPAVVGGAGSRDGARRRGWARQGGWDREAGTGPGVGSRVGGRGVACPTCWPLRACGGVFLPFVVLLYSIYILGVRCPHCFARVFHRRVLEGKPAASVDSDAPRATLGTPSKVGLTLGEAGPSAPLVLPSSCSVDLSVWRTRLINIS